MVHSFDKPTAKTIAQYRIPTGVLAVTLSADSKFAYAACIDGVYEVDLETGEETQLYQHESYCSGVVHTDDPNCLISAGYDGRLKWFDLKSRSVVRQIKAHEFWSWEIDKSSDDRFIASATGQYLAGSYKYEPKSESEPSVKIFDAANGDVIHQLSHVPSVQAVAFSADSQYVAAGNIMGEVRVWNVLSGDLVANWTTSDLTSWGIIKSHCYIGGIFSLKFTADNERLLVAGMGPMRDPMAGNGKQLWQEFDWKEVPARKVKETLDGQSGEGLMETLSIHPSGEFFLMGGRLRGGKWNAALFDSESGHLLHSLNTKFRMTDSCFTTDGKRLIVSGCRSQAKRNEEKDRSWGAIDIYELEESSTSA